MQAEFKECELKNQALESFCESNFLTILHRHGESRRQEMRRYCLCAVMICNKDNVIQLCNRIIPGSGKIKSGNSDRSTMYLS